MGTLKRYNDWDLRLDAFFRDAHQFEWCAIFAADAVLAMTGIDLVADFRKIKTKSAMRKAAIKYCGSYDMEAVARKGLGAPINPKLAQRGDVVSCDVGDGIALGVCMGAKSMFIAEVGVVRIDTSQCLNAWRIG